MMNWTKTAKDYLHEHVATITQLPATSDEYQDVYTDLKAHAEEEIHRAKLSIIGLSEIEMVLSEMGEDEFEEEVVRVNGFALAGGKSWDSPADAANSIARWKSSTSRGIRFSCAWLFTIIIPLIALMTELFTHQAGAIFFDPIPSWFHVILITLVPITFFLVRRLKRHFDDAAASGSGGDRNDRSLCRKARITAGLLGFILPTIIYYTLLFLPLTPVAIIGCLFLLGLLPLAPLFAFVGWWWARLSLLETLRQTQENTAKKWLRYGMIAGLVSIVSLEAPGYLRQYAISRATSDDPVIQRSGVEQIRTLGGEKLLLHFCYFANRRSRGIESSVGQSPAHWAVNYIQPVKITTEQARELYYRVTGVPFNAVKPSRDHGAGAERFDGWSWDADHGGDAVAGRIRGLNLYSSRLDMHIDDESRLGYVEWIIEFKNHQDLPREARMQIALPHDGFVSKLSLWVDGEERPAAFSTVSKVKAAYREIAVAQRKDPVLVNVSGADRVMLQCFPVPGNGGIMKMKLGITFPLDAVADLGTIQFPYIAERNFNIPQDLQHNVYAQSDMEIRRPEASKRQVGVQDTLQFSLNYAMLKTERIIWKDRSKNSESQQVWAEDPFQSGAGKYLMRTTHLEMSKQHTKLIVVVDGSASMDRWKSMIRSAILEKHPEILFYVASNGGNPLRGGENGTDIEKIKFVGGVDNIPALRAAMRQARAANDGANTLTSILWIHGAQPVKFKTIAGLEQDLERASSALPIYSVALEDGENHIIRAFKDCADFKGTSRVLNETDLVNVVSKIIKPRAKASYTWSRVSTPPVGGVQVWDQLVRKWAHDTTIAQWRSGKNKTSLAERAAHYQLVTPVSGAVVLESAAQYRQTGLQPPSNSNSPNIPAVPEPSSSLMILLGSLFMTLRRNRVETSPAAVI